MTKTRIVLADDHPIVLAGLRMLIAAEPDLDLVGEAENGSKAHQLIRDIKPDIAILDISLPNMNGIVLARHIAEELPSIGIIILTSHEDRSYLNQALEAGVRGYVLKQSAAQCLVNAIRGVLVGGLYIDPTIAAHVLPLAGNGMRPKQKALTPTLTERETEVLKLIAAGMTSKDIAVRLALGIKSVETYKVRGTSKIGVKTRAEIMRYASAQGWLASI